MYADLDITVKPINIKCPAEIVSVELSFNNGQKLIVCTLYRVGTLGALNFTKVQACLQNIAKRRGLSNLIVLGDLNMATTNWSTLESTCPIEGAFIDLLQTLASPN